MPKDSTLKSPTNAASCRMQRRGFISLIAAAGMLPVPLQAQPLQTGRLMVIGGAEDRKHDRLILNRFVELCGGPNARIRLITAASGDPQASWRGYEPVFRDIGVTDCEPLPLLTRDDANDPSVVQQIMEADGIFMTGGDQNRLMQVLWETEAFRAIHAAFHRKGCCIAGTSAGAAAMSRQMLAQGSALPLPEKDAAVMDIGLGLVSKAIIDQHFSERRRLGRLLSALAQRPDMLGVGIDEDTALVIEKGRSIEVVGQGTVTLIDARRMYSNFEEVDSSERLEMLGVQLHLLQSGHRYAVPYAKLRSKHLPSSLTDALSLLVKTGPMRG